MAQNIGGNVGFGSVVSSLFGGDAGKRPGAAHARMPRGGRLGELYWPVLVPAVLLLAYGLVVAHQRRRVAAAPGPRSRARGRVRRLRVAL